MNGISARAQNIDLTDEIRSIVESINSSIKFRGYWFIQLKKTIGTSLNYWKLVQGFLEHLIYLKVWMLICHC